MSNTLLTTELGQYHLQRWPVRERETLQAWDAADEYLLNRYVERNPVRRSMQVVILNDGFGALAVALHEHNPTVISDSYLAHQAIQHNFQQNPLAQQTATVLDSLSVPSVDKIDCLLIKVPKTLALLEYQLQSLRPFLKPDTCIIAGAMVKHLTPSVTQLLERWIGPCQASLAWKKARLLEAQYDAQLPLPKALAPTSYTVESSGLSFMGHANVFARERLDIGSRFLLEHLPSNPEYIDYADLGCGNGVIGVHIALYNPQAHLQFVDESFMAIASARNNFEAAFADQRCAQFLVADGLEALAPASLDCVVVNPPFHQQHTIGEQTALRMFQQAHRVLRKGGELRVIGNRHLSYPQRLKQLFGNMQLVASNPKFVIVKSLKR